MRGRKLTLDAEAPPVVERSPSERAAPLDALDVLDRPADRDVRLTPDRPAGHAARPHQQRDSVSGVANRVSSATLSRCSSPDSSASETAGRDSRACAASIHRRAFHCDTPYRIDNQCAVSRAPRSRQTRRRSISAMRLSIRRCAAATAACSASMSRIVRLRLGAAPGPRWGGGGKCDQDIEHTFDWFKTIKKAPGDRLDRKLASAARTRSTPGASTYPRSKYRKSSQSVTVLLSKMICSCRPMFTRCPNT